LNRNSEPIVITPARLLLGGITSLAFGVSVVVNKAGLDHSELNTSEYTALSALVAGMLALPAVIARGRRVLSCSKTCLIKILIIALLATGIANVFLFQGQARTSATNAGFVLTLTAFFTVTFASLLLGERIDKRKYPAVAALFAGLYLLTVGTRSFSLNAGDLFIVGTAVTWGFSNAIARSIMREISSQAIAWVRLVFGAIFLMALFRVGPVEGFSAATGGDYWFVLSGIIGWAAILLFYKAIELLGASTAALVVVSFPVFSTLGAILFLGETLSAEDLIGGALIFISLIGITRVSRSRHAV
jgi:drug/metabolite transporter (DMT)-like permease